MASSNASSIQRRMPGLFPVLLSWWRARPYTVVGAVFFLAMAVPFYLRQGSEWEVHYVHAARHMWTGQDMYLLQDGYLYPPFMAWLALPFTFLSQGLGRLFFYGINVLCMLFLCRWAWIASGGKTLQGAPAIPKSEHWIFLFGLACGLRFILDGLAHQQTDLIIGCLVMGGCLALFRSRPWLGATAFGLAAGMKCTALLWCPYLLWRRQWAAAAWLVVVAMGVNLLPNLVSSSPDGGLWVSDWLQRYLLPLQNANCLPGTWGSDIIYNQSLSGLGQRWFETQWVWTEADFSIVTRANPMSPGELKGLVHGAEVLLLMAAVLALGWRERLPKSRKTSEVFHPSADPDLPPRQAFEFSLVLLLMLLLSPMSSKPHFCTLVLPGFCLARRAIGGRDFPAALLLELAIIAGGLTVRSLWGDALSTFALWWGSITWGALLLFLACVYCLRVKSGGVAAKRDGTFETTLIGATYKLPPACPAQENELPPLVARTWEPQIVPYSSPAAQGR